LINWRNGLVSTRLKTIGAAKNRAVAKVGIRAGVIVGYSLSYKQGM